MSLILIKTDKNNLKCIKCQGKDFVKVGFSWACYKCGLYVYPNLKEIKNES